MAHLLGLLGVANEMETFGKARTRVQTRAELKHRALLFFCGDVEWGSRWLGLKEF